MEPENNRTRTYRRSVGSAERCPVRGEAGLNEFQVP